MFGLDKIKTRDREKMAMDEIGESQNIPFSHHYDKNTICNKDGTLFQIIAMKGIAFETINDNELISEKKNRNQLFTSSTDELTGIYTYLHPTSRRENDPGRFV